MNDLLNQKLSFKAALGWIGAISVFLFSIFMAVRAYEMAEVKTITEASVRAEYRQAAIDETQIQLAQLKVQLTRIESRLLELTYAIDNHVTEYHK